MKISTLAIASILAFGVTAANAADQGSGKVTFNGSIIDAPCSIAADSLDQAVSLGAIATAALENGGTSTEVPFHINLQGCVITAGTKDKLSVTFTGMQSPYDQYSLGLLGGAAGASIELLTTNLQQVKLGEATAPITLNPLVTNPTLTFNARLKGSTTPGELVPGAFSVPANFVLAYQ